MTFQYFPRIAEHVVAQFLDQKFISELPAANVINSFKDASYALREDNGTNEISFFGTIVGARSKLELNVGIHLKGKSI